MTARLRVHATTTVSPPPTPEFPLCSLAPSSQAVSTTMASTPLMTPNNHDRRKQRTTASHRNRNASSAYLKVSFAPCLAIYIHGYSEISTPYPADGEIVRFASERYIKRRPQVRTQSQSGLRRGRTRLKWEDKIWRERSSIPTSENLNLFLLVSHP